MDNATQQYEKDTPHFMVEDDIIARNDMDSSNINKESSK